MELQNTKYIILGAGPAGLTFANRLLQLGESDFLIIEKENEAGGLCRSVNVDESPLDIGGGHFLDSKNQDVLDFVFGFMDKSEWNIFNRNSQIDLYGTFINSPIEANIWQLPIDAQVEYLESIAIAGCCLGEPMPEKFTDWIYWKLGKKIADDYMIPYNRKMFGENLNELGTYWLNKLPNVSLKETFVSCLEKKAYGKQPGHAIFYYPKETGYGELWKLMAEKLGDRIIYNEAVSSIDYDSKIINGKYKADKIISTIPWTSVTDHISMPAEIKGALNELKHTSVVISYQQDDIDTEAHWIYYPDPKKSFHRILVRKNFCIGSKGYWTETNLDRFENDKSGNEFFINEYAYPLNTINKNNAITGILQWAESKGVYGLGRWGEWQHYNSDVVVDLAIKKADNFIK